MTTTTYETQARARKATVLAAWCRENDVTADMAAVATDRMRAEIAGLAGCNVPSDETWLIVVDCIAMLERTTPTDPFAGL